VVEVRLVVVVGVELCNQYLPYSTLARLSVAFHQRILVVDGYFGLRSF